MEPSELQNLIDVWKVLEMLTVSLDRLGTYERTHGKEAGTEALDQFINSEVANKISTARSLIVQIMEQHDIDIRDRLEVLAENEEEIGYWRGKRSSSK